MTFLEKSGRVLGYILGCFTALGSFLRKSRLFHPVGILYEARVKSDIVPPYALVRFSGAWWKDKEWPDVLGISIRFSSSPTFMTNPHEDDQDLLFATFPKAWMIFMGPFITDHHHFLNNKYYAIKPFRRGGLTTKYKISSEHHPGPGSRINQLREIQKQKNITLFLWELDSLTQNWRIKGEIKLIKESQLDQDFICFNPFQNGHGIIPQGFIHHLRIGSYKLGQWARMRAKCDSKRRMLKGS